jgi:hypothetical protein
MQAMQPDETCCQTQQSSVPARWAAYRAKAICNWNEVFCQRIGRQGQRAEAEEIKNFS